MSTPMLAFVSDLHLSPRLYRSIPDMVGDSYAAWDEVVRKVCEIKPVAVIIGGDIFDTTPDPTTLDKFAEGTQALNKAGIFVYAIQGQHGRDWNKPWPSVCQGLCEDLNAMYVRTYGAGEPTSTKIGNRIFKDLIVTGFDNAPAEQVKENLAALASRPPEILCLHQMCRRIVPEFSGHQTWDLDPEWVPPGVKLVLMGDYHVPEEFVKANSNGSHTKFIYNGSTVPKSVSEPDDKSFIIVNDDYSITRVPLTPYRKMVRLHLEGPQTPEQLQPTLNMIKSQPDGTLFYIKYDMRIEALEEKVRTAGLNKFFLLKPNLCVDTVVQDDAMPQSISLAGCLDQVCSRAEDPEFFDFLLTMLKDDQPQTTLSVFRNRVMKGEAVQDPLPPPVVVPSVYDGPEEEIPF